MATPRGLIFISQAGQIDPTVHQYAKEKLDIVCEIPGLHINQDGSLSGGQIEGAQGDVFDQVRSKADQDTGVVIGPDSIGTLSFTSGSTGIPKGMYHKDCGSFIFSKTCLLTFLNNFQVCAVVTFH